MDRLDAMAVFVRVVELESFTAAAREMGVTQPTISKKIAGLEDELGVKLLHRSTRQLSMTGEGELFYERALEILGSFEEVREAVRAGLSEPRGTLRLSAPMTFGRLHVAPELPAFLARYPNIDVDLRLDDRFVDPVEEGMDAALRIGTLEPSTLIARKLGSSPRVLVASPEYLERCGAPNHPHELTQHACLIYTHLSTGATWRLTDAEGRTVTVRVGGRVRANNADVLRELAEAGQGIAVLPLWLVSGALERGVLVQCLERWQPRKPEIYLVYPPTRFMPRKVRVLSDFLKARFAALE